MHTKTPPPTAGWTPRRSHRAAQTYFKTESVGNPWPRDMSTITAPLTTHLSFYKAFSSQPFIREVSTTAQPLNVHTSFESFFRKSFRARTTVQNMFFREKVTSKEILKRRDGATFVIIRKNPQIQKIFLSCFKLLYKPEFSVLQSRMEYSVCLQIESNSGASAWTKSSSHHLSHKLTV